jgi:hypothetical protein
LIHFEWFRSLTLCYSTEQEAFYRLWKITWGRGPQGYREGGEAVAITMPVTKTIKATTTRINRILEIKLGTVSPLIGIHAQIISRIAWPRVCGFFAVSIDFQLCKPVYPNTRNSLGGEMKRPHFWSLCQSR